jgi:hypothetical protein
MATKQTQAEDKSKVSTVKLAVGAASLFLFIVGLKRTFRVDEARGTRTTEDADGTNGDGRTAAGRPH